MLEGQGGESCGEDGSTDSGGYDLVGIIDQSIDEESEEIFNHYAIDNVSKMSVKGDLMKLQSHTIREISRR